MPDSQDLTVRVVEALRDLPQAAWDGLLRPQDPPFLEWHWLQALEEAGCVAPEAGWQPMHLTVWREGASGAELIGAAPAYLKGHSQGEFVFDWSWAEAAEGLGVAYYPKLIVAVPFTPVTGPRLLCRPDLPEEEEQAVRTLLGRAASSLAAQLGLSSAHILFPDEGQAASLAAAGWLPRLGVQLHWHNPGYQGFDDFLGRFNAKRRHMLRRERRAVAEAGVQVATRRGPFSKADVARMYRTYLSTVDKHVWGRRYLNQRFFSLVAERMPDKLEFVEARLAGEAIAGAINLAKAGRLYGRYWGQVAGPEVPFLHFEVCYYHSIEECIARGFTAFEPGAGGEHKEARGFDPTLTHSVHQVRDGRLRRAIAHFLARETAAIRGL